MRGSRSLTFRKHGVEGHIRCYLRCRSHLREQHLGRYICCAGNLFRGPSHEHRARLAARSRNRRKHLNALSLYHFRRRVAFGVFLAVHSPCYLPSLFGVRHSPAARTVIAVAHARHESRVRRADQQRHIHRLARVRTPYILRQIRIVDERIAVALRGLNAVVAVNLLLRYRVFAVPFHQQRNTIVGESELARSRIVAAKNLATIAGGKRLMIPCPSEQCAHISAGKITFVLVLRFKDCPRARHRCPLIARKRIAARDSDRQSRAFLAAVIRIIGVAHLAKSIITAHAVHLAVGRHQVENIAAGTTLRTPVPRLGNTMLAIPAVALFAIVAAAVFVQIEIAVRVHVP